MRWLTSKSNGNAVPDRGPTFTCDYGKTHQVSERGCDCAAIAASWRGTRIVAKDEGAYEQTIWHTCSDGHGPTRMRNGATCTRSQCPEHDGHSVIFGSCSCRCCCAGVWHCHRTGFGCYMPWENGHAEGGA